MILTITACPTKQEYIDALNAQIQSLDHMKYQKFFLSLYRSIVKGIIDFFNSFSNSASSGSSGNNVWAQGLAILFVVVLVLIIIFVVFIIVKNLRKDTKIRYILGEKLDENSTVTTLQDKANAFYAQQEYRMAVRFRFIGMLLYLHESNILHHDESMTGYEMIQLLKDGNYPAFESFDAVVVLFNLYWYGREKISLEDHALWIEREEIFWKEARRDEKVAT